MDDEQRRSAKRQIMVLMQMGRPWQEAASITGVQTSRSTACIWFQAFRLRGEAALHDERHGHYAKVLEPLQRNLIEVTSSKYIRHVLPFRKSS